MNCTNFIYQEEMYRNDLTYKQQNKERRVEVEVKTPHTQKKHMRERPRHGLPGGAVQARGSYHLACRGRPADPAETEGRGDGNERCEGIDKREEALYLEAINENMYCNTYLHSYI